MKYVDEFRDGALAKNIAANIARGGQSAIAYRLMEFCGGIPTPFAVTASAICCPPMCR